jgi:hypothetical protein
MYLVPRKMGTARILLRMSRKKNKGRNVGKMRVSSGIFHTLQEAMNAIARSTSTPDQSSSMLLIAKAQYVVRRSESPPCAGSVEKLVSKSLRMVHNSEKFPMRTCHLPSD